MTAPGHMYRRLQEAVSHRGSARSVYGQDTTLSRRGLLTRADRRARELIGLGVGAGDLVALSMGNVVDLLVLLLATSKLGAAAAVVDPANGDRSLLELTERLPVRAVVRRPRGATLSTTSRASAGSGTTGTMDYGDTANVTSRRRLASSLLSVDVLEPQGDRPALPKGAEVVVEARGIGGVLRYVTVDGAALEVAGKASVSALDLDEGARLLTAQPLTVPRFFLPVVLGWLASEAQLVMAEGPAVSSVLPLARAHERLVVVESVRQLLEMARAIKTAGAPVSLRPVIVQSSAASGLGRRLKAAFGDPGRQLLLLEELGVIAHRPLTRGSAFAPADGVSLCAGAAMETGGHEVLAQTPHEVSSVPQIPETHPGALADPPFRHTGYAGRFSKTGALTEILGRDDGLVGLEGRRACLDQIEEAMLAHRRLTWVRAFVKRTDGESELHVEYRATGQTEVEDLEEHAIGELPPHMVPRSLVRLEE